MRIKIMVSFLTLFLGLSPLAMAVSGGYLISDTPITVNYIICSASKHQECTKEKTPLEPAVTLNETQKIYIYAVKNIPKNGVARIISLIADHKRSYMYADDNNSPPCLLFNNGAIKFEVYDNVILCNSHPAAVAQ